MDWSLRIRPFFAIFSILFLILLVVVVCAPGYSYNKWKGNRGHLTSIDDYFSKLNEKGWEIDRSLLDLKLVQRPITYNYGIVEKIEIHTWRARENEEDPYLEYSWLLMPDNEESISHLEMIGVATDNWWKKTAEHTTQYGTNSILLPLNAESLAVHIELGLKLPVNYDFNVIDIDSISGVE